MTQQATKKEYNTFVKGIITEAGALTFPENASLDEENCVLNRDGSRQRRLGMDFEDDFVLRNVITQADDAIASFRWFNAANDVANQLAVVQVGTRLLIFDATAPSISADFHAVVNLSAYITGKTVIGTASGMGYFFVTGGTDKPLYLAYDPATHAVTVTEIDIKIRDIFGVDDGTEVNIGLPTINDAHRYNLYNQGWDSSKVSAYRAAIPDYPVNNQQWFIGKNTDDDFDPLLLVKHDFGTTPAPKGRYILDAFARSTSRDAQSGLTTPVDIETGYPSVVGFAFERVFYAGIESAFNTASTTSPNYSGFVFYSRTLRDTRDFGQCYTDADPTSEMDSELVDTDGGFVNIPESGRIYKMIQKGGSMVVFAENGIWEIAGDAGGFRATAHQVVKLSEFGVLSGSSIVDTEDSMLYWNRGGIYMIAPDEATGRLSSKNISENSIQTLYNAIDKVGKQNAVGSFDPINRRVSWMYNDELDYTGATFRNRYNKELVLDIVLAAFYKHSISEHEDPSPYIAGYVETPDFLLREEGIRTRGDSVTKYLAVQFTDPAANLASVSFAYYRDPTLRDWKSIDGVGVSYLSYLLTGYEIMQDSARNKQSPYLFMHFKRTEQNAVLDADGNVVPDNPSGCIVQAQWDWSNHESSGKWGQEFQAYRLQRNYVLTLGEPINYGFEVVTTKNRLPGRGRALSLYIRSDGDKDFYLYGWATRFTGDSNV